MPSGKSDHPASVRDPYGIEGTNRLDLKAHGYVCDCDGDHSFTLREFVRELAIWATQDARNAQLDDMLNGRPNPWALRLLLVESTVCAVLAGLLNSADTNTTTQLVAAMNLAKSELQRAIESMFTEASDAASVTILANMDPDSPKN